MIINSQLLMNLIVIKMEVLRIESNTGQFNSN